MIARDLGVSPGAAGLLVTASQVGYAAGLVLLVPLGDLLDRRRMVWRLLLVTAVGLVVAAVAPSFAVLAPAIGVIGVTAVVAQVLVPLAGTLAAEHERGKVVGNVMSGLLLGILLARTASGLIAEARRGAPSTSIGAALMVAVAVVLRRALPPTPPATDLPYRARCARSSRWCATSPCCAGAWSTAPPGMACFSVLWTAIAFLLSGAPVSLRRGDDRPLRPGRAGGRGRRAGRRAARRPRPHRTPPRALPGRDRRRVGAARALAAPRWRC